MNRTLLRLGFVLVLLALLAGLVVPQFRNPRLGLVAHTVGLLGGLLLVVPGAVTGAGRLTPQAGAATSGGPAAEAAVAFLLLSLALAAIAGTGLAVWGLREKGSS